MKEMCDYWLNPLNILIVPNGENKMLFLSFVSRVLASMRNMSHDGCLPASRIPPWFEFRNRHPNSISLQEKVIFSFRPRNVPLSLRHQIVIRTHCLWMVVHVCRARNPDIPLPISRRNPTEIESYPGHIWL
jgi:hypothetical protein